MPAPDYTWLPADQVLRWLKADSTSQHAEVIEDLRKVAGDYCERQRPDLVVDGRFAATPAVIQAAVLSVARLFARIGSPAGLASYGEFGAAEILRLDPDVSRLLEVGLYGKPAVG